MAEYHGNDCEGGIFVPLKMDSLKFSAEDAALEYAQGYGIEDGDSVWVAWHRIPNREYDSEFGDGEENAPYYLRRSAGPFVVCDDGERVEGPDA